MSLFDDLKPIFRGLHETSMEDPRNAMWDDMLEADLLKARKALEMLAFTWFCKYGSDDVQQIIDELAKLEEIEGV